MRAPIGANTSRDDLGGGMGNDRINRGVGGADTLWGDEGERLVPSAFGDRP